MKIFKILSVMLILSSGTANAAEVQSDFDVLQNLTKALRARDYAGAEQYVTTGSQDLLKRYSKHDLGDMTPATYKFVKQVNKPSYRYITIQSSDNAQQKPKNTVVAFTNENNQPKVDLPESLRIGFGPNWQKRVNMIEQSYIFSKQQFGDEQSTELLNNLLKK